MLSRSCFPVCSAPLLRVPWLGISSCLLNGCPKVKHLLRGTTEAAFLRRLSNPCTLSIGIKRIQRSQIRTTPKAMKAINHVLKEEYQAANWTSHQFCETLSCSRILFRNRIKSIATHQYIALDLVQSRDPQVSKVVLASCPPHLCFRRSEASETASQQNT